MDDKFTLLMQGLDDEETLFNQMLTLSAQEVALCSEHTDSSIVKPLNGLIAQRQHLMKEIDQISSAAGKLKEELGFAGKDLPSREMTDSRCSAYWAKRESLRGIIQSIQANDSKCRRSAQDILDELGNKISVIRKNKKAYNAYTGNNACPQAWFFDKKK